MAETFPKKLSVYIRSTDKKNAVTPEDERAFQEARQEHLREIRRYIAEGPFVREGDDEKAPVIFRTVSVCSVGSLAEDEWKIVRATLLGEPLWQHGWKKQVACHYWFNRIQILCEEHSFARSQTESDFTYRGTLNFRATALQLGNLIAVGWLDMAVRHAQGMLHMFDIDGYHDAGDGSRRRTQHFLLRLVSNWQGWPERNTPACAYDEPLFNALIEHWRTDDLELIQHLLLCACDRHTHQSRVDSYSRGEMLFDFSWPYFDYNPVEILSVLRLRQTLGLPNPELDHPIMNTPLGKLMEPSEPYTDELLEGVIARACLEFPELCKGTNIQPAVPVPPSGPTAPAAKSWLGKLLGKS